MEDFVLRYLLTSPSGILSSEPVLRFRFFFHKPDSLQIAANISNDNSRW